MGHDVKTTLAILLTAAAVTAAGCGTAEHESAQAAEPTPVSLGRAQRTELASSLEAGGVVRARSTAVIASRILAPVVDVHVRAGDRVKRGSRLVTLDGREISANRAGAAAGLSSAVEASRAAEAEVRAAEASAAMARATYERVRALHGKRSATAQELDQAVTARDAAEAQVASARARSAAAAAAREASQSAADAASVAASYALLTAPFDGIVTERSVDPGSMAAPGAPLLVVEDPSAFRLEVRVDEARAGQVSVGQAATVSLGDGDGSEREVAAKVGEIGRVDPSAHSFLVKLDLAADPSLRSGLFGRARLEGPARPALTVPAAAAVRRGQLTFVFTVDGEERVRLQPVSVGRTTADRVEILAGVREGARVVVDPPPSLADGARVSEARP